MILDKGKERLVIVVKGTVINDVFHPFEKENKWRESRDSNQRIIRVK